MANAKKSRAVHHLRLLQSVYWRLRVFQCFQKGSHTTPASLHGATTTLEADAKSNRECANKNKTAVAIGFEKAWKRKLCWHYERGTCKRTASECAFAHGEEDLRHPAMPDLTLSHAMLASTEHLQWSNANKNA